MSDTTHIKIEVEYVTHSLDQSVYITLFSSKKLRAGLSEPLKMKSKDGRIWEFQFDVPTNKIEELDYGFTVRSKHSFIDEEKGHGKFPHHIFWT